VSTKLEVVPARIINETLFCERLLYLEWVQGQFADNYFTEDGNAVHKRADVPSGGLPPLDETSDRGDADYQARSVWLTSETLGISAKIDVVDGTSDGYVTPVEYKRGKLPDVPEGAYLPERAQVCAQVLLLREHGYTVEYGEIYFAAAKCRVRITITDDLIETVKRAAARARELKAQLRMPPPLVDDPRCVGCSLVGICLPDEVYALDISKTVPQYRPALDDKTPLHVQEQGAKVGLRGECLTVKSKSGETQDARLVHTSNVCIYGNVQVSTQALRALLYREVPVSFFTTGGWYCGQMVGSAPQSNVQARIAQFARFADSKFCTYTASVIVRSKIKNCRTLLRRNSECSGDALLQLDQLAYDLGSSRRFHGGYDGLLGIEGAAARVYFQAFSSMLRSASEFSFESRNRRPPKDPVNALLSLAYALLAKDFTIAIQTAGLDPTYGFYHQPRPQRPALALDLMEEFRPLIADSTVITAINTGIVHEDDFVRVADAVSLKPHARRAFIQAYERRMDQEVTHPVFGYKISYRRVLEVQARLFAYMLTGEVAEYPQFTTR
jgi:CRISPR-associated protein Cas1